LQIDENVLMKPQDVCYYISPNHLVCFCV